MSLGPEAVISLRYLLTKRKEKFLSLISFISIAGVAIGVMALIVVLAVMTGFDRDLRDRIVGNFSHITVSSFRPVTMADYGSLDKKLRQNPHVVSTSPFIQGQVLVEQDGKYMALGVKGIDPARESRVTKLSKLVVRGSYKDLVPGSVLIGRELATLYGLPVGAELRVITPKGERTSLKVAGIFATGMYDYDLNLMVVPLATAQKLLGMGETISAVEVNLDNIYNAEKVKKELEGAVGYEYFLRTWIDSNANFFAALKLEKLTMFIILTLVILVASFNVVSTLIVMVVEKTRDIGILKSIGMNAASIRRIFTYEGLIIGTAGTLAGTIGGVVVCLLLKKYQFIKLPAEVYYIDKLPVALTVWPDLALVVGSALAITLLATVYPAMKAAQLKPVEALRYE
ncbi:MAG: ABC transporter permease [Deltaproteobacteria bacterium]